MIRWLTALYTAWSETSLRDFMFGVALGAVVVLFAVVSLGFGTYAAYLSLSECVGDANAAAIISAAYAVLALAICLIGMRYRRTRRLRRTAAIARAPVTDVDALLQSLGQESLGGSGDQRALIAAMQLGRQLTPTQLLVVALMGGFIAGRKLDK